MDPACLAAAENLRFLDKPAAARNYAQPPFDPLQSILLQLQEMALQDAATGLTQTLAALHAQRRTTPVSGDCFFWRPSWQSHLGTPQ